MQEGRIVKMPCVHFYRFAFQFQYKPYAVRHLTLSVLTEAVYFYEYLQILIPQVTL